MKILFKTFFSIGVLLAASSSTHSFAQSCGGGYTQEGGSGVISCISTDDGNNQNPQILGPQWATRWGSIAVDGKNGKFGGIEGFASEAKAKKAAIAECKKNGGKVCIVNSTYYNQCGVLAWGDNRYTGFTGPEINQTINLAISACSKETSNCRAYYAGCSYAERVR